MLVRILSVLIVLAPLVLAPGGSEYRAPERGRPQGKSRFRPPAVYVDGEPLAVLRFSELPPALPPIWKELSDGRLVRRFSFVAWLRQVGVEPSSLVGAHFHGGRNRVARITGAELARADVLFSFSQDTRGKLRLEWPAGVDVGDTVDGVRAIALYRELPPPPFNRETWRLELDGQPVDGIAYADEIPGGLRVYVDGRLEAVVRRAEVGEEGRNLAAVLARHEIAPEGVRAADLVFGDHGSTRVAPDRLSSLRVRGLKGSGGQLLLEDSNRRVSALLLHRQAAPQLHDAENPRPRPIR